MDIGVVPAARTLESRLSDLDQPVLLTGIQAIVRVLLEQARLDRAAGLNTGGLVSGYRGSPLGGLDQELWRRAKLLDAAGVRFQPGLNEDLAATMLWGSQQLDAFPGKRVDGVFGLWYGKGPGVDRSADALRCANHMGTSRHGGVLAVAGDDHGAHSSTFPHQTDQIFEAVMIPVLQPADAKEIVSLGLAGIAMSRFSGLWTALKTIAETAEQSRTFTVPSRRAWRTPEFPVPPHGLNFDATLPWPAQRFELERRVLEERLPAALAWARANGLDRLVAGDARAEVGIVAVGKAWQDVRHALRLLGIEGAPWLSVFKVAMTWPIETEGLRAFARGKRALIVVEEKRSLVEAQLRDALYNLPADERPPIAGKLDFAGAPLMPAPLELGPEIVAPALARVLAGLGYAVSAPPAPAPLAKVAHLIARAPMFCAGCPHNTSTVVPEGSFAVAGIGCHAMALTTSEVTHTFSHMGGEGVPWVGMAPFTTTPHMFANLGDGTYQHSGLLAIRQAVAAEARITYKILYNDAVAMTGGQPAEGGPTPAMIARQVAAEGVSLIALVADDAARLPPAEQLPPGTLRHGREDLDAVQKRLREHAGVSVLIYDQVCATEKRRRRKRGKMAAADRVVTINERVCENCGDCTAQSNCIAIEPVETEYGRKRRISPTSCNTDLSCLKGFCPSFVTAPATVTAKAKPAESPWLAREAELAAGLPEPALPSAHYPWRGLFAGIGGGGIVTAGAVVAMAAHLEGRQVSTLDFTGLAQKNGAVVSHVQVADPDAGGDALDTVRIPAGEAHVMIAADLAVSAGADVLGRASADAAVIGNLDLQAGAGFLKSRDLRVDVGLHRRSIERRTGAARSRYVHAARLAERLFGSAQVLNTVMLGMAWQSGLVPVGQAALLRAFELNGTAVALNRRAFLWGRLLAHDPELAAAILDDRPADESLDALVARRAAELVEYGDERLAARYRALVARAAEREAAVAGQPGALARAVAEGYFRVLAYKDEYEVARLHADAGLPAGARVHLSPPLPLGQDPATGRRRKVVVPGWLALPAFRALRHGKRLRGTAMDPFGWQADRRAERAMIAAYEADLARVLDGLRADQVADAAALARLPLDVRGFGVVKAASMEAGEMRRRALLDGLGRVERVAVAAE
jgi:indolepyruvate ferredoxin oxidoreductase